jgi:hypothetical protein
LKVFCALTNKGTNSRIAIKFLIKK